MTFKLFAIRYAYRQASRSEHFYGSIDRPVDPMPMSYYVWLAVGSDQAILIDTGFTARTAERRGRAYLISPPDCLRRLGVEPDQIETVILTHLHYDHVGGLGEFQRANFVVQADEMAFWTGRHAARVGLPHLIDPEDIVALCRANFAGQIKWVDGDQEVTPGIDVFLVGGHTVGMQIVRVATEAGMVVLASDASHFYENINSERPYAVVDSLPSMYGAFDRIRQLASDSKYIIPGHDPAVMDNFTAAAPDLADVAVRIA